MRVVIDRLVQRRGGRCVLEVDHLALRPGVVTALLGPNGAGKSTLLDLLAGLRAPSTGGIRLDGRPPRHPAVRAEVAIAFQESVFVDRSVAQNLELALELRGLEPGARRRRLRAAAEWLEIEPLLERPARALSGGEARRVNLARALSLEAPLTLLDEPLAGIDPLTRRSLLDRLPRLLRAPGRTAIIVTHDGEEAMRLADDLVVLIDGRVRAAGRKRDVVRRPGDAAVAELLGHAVVTVDGARYAVPPGGLTLDGAGPVLELAVEGVAELLDRREVLGRVGGANVRVPLTPEQAEPAPGDRLAVRMTVAARLDEASSGG